MAMQYFYGYLILNLLSFLIILAHSVTRVSVTFPLAELVEWQKIPISKRIADNILQITWATGIILLLAASILIFVYFYAIRETSATWSWIPIVKISFQEQIYYYAKRRGFEDKSGNVVFGLEVLEPMLVEHTETLYKKDEKYGYISVSQRMFNHYKQLYEWPIYAASMEDSSHIERCGKSFCNFNCAHTETEFKSCCQASGRHENRSEPYDYTKRIIRVDKWFDSEEIWKQSNSNRALLLQWHVHRG